MWSKQLVLILARVTIIRAQEPLVIPSLSKCGGGPDEDPSICEEHNKCVKDDTNAPCANGDNVNACTCKPDIEDESPCGGGIGKVPSSCVNVIAKCLNDATNAPCANGDNVNACTCKPVIPSLSKCGGGPEEDPSICEEHNKCVKDDTNAPCANGDNVNACTCKPVCRNTAGENAAACICGTGTTQSCTAGQVCTVTATNGVCTNPATTETPVTENDDEGMGAGAIVGIIILVVVVVALLVFGVWYFKCREEE